MRLWTTNKMKKDSENCVRALGGLYCAFYCRLTRESYDDDLTSPFTVGWLNFNKEGVQKKTNISYSFMHISQAVQLVSWFIAKRRLGKKKYVCIPFRCITTTN